MNSRSPFGFDVPEDSPGFLLWQTTMLWQRQIKKVLEAYDVSHAQFVIMATLMWFGAHQIDTTQIFIVQHTKLDKMTVSKSLKNLVHRGFVTRMEHESDMRAKSVTLTDRGIEMVRILVPIVEGIDAEFFGAATASEGKQLNALLHKLISRTQA